MLGCFRFAVAMFALVAVLFASSMAVAQTCGPNGCPQDEFFDVGPSTGAASFAARLNDRGALFHDRAFNGPEVVYRSSQPATEADALAAWYKSPGHRQLVASGKITEIECVGHVCVGRGAGYSTAENQPVRNVARRGVGIVQRVANGVRRVFSPRR